MISINARFLNIRISQINKTRSEIHLACSFKHEEDHRYHYYLVRVISWVRFHPSPSYTVRYRSVTKWFGASFYDDHDRKVDGSTPTQASDGVLEYSTRTRVQLEYHFVSTRTRNPRYSVSTRTRRSMYSVLGQKKRQVHEYIWLTLEVTNKMNFR